MGYITCNNKKVYVLKYHAKIEDLACLENVWYCLSSGTQEDH